MELENTCEPDNAILEEIEDDNVKKIKDMLKPLYDIWNKIGVDEEQKKNRANLVWGYVTDLVKDIVSEEEVFYEDIKERIKNYEKKIAELTSELSVPKSEGVTGTLILVEEKLRQELDRLSKLKHKRCKEFHDLHALELKYCKMLGMPPLNLSSTAGVPSESDLYELGQHVNMLKTEKEHRYKKFHSLRKELTTILETTELTPETPLEKEMLYNKDDYLSLSNETFKRLEEIVSKTRSKKEDLEKEKNVLMDKLTTLWDRLNIDKTERQIFLSKYNDCRLSHLNAIKQEIARCEEIKRQNLKKYIDVLKEELVMLWEKCFISDSEKQFSYFNVQEVNEEVLEAYDSEVAKWRQYFKDTEDIISKIHERNKLWDLMIVFENKAADPNRFVNRGGNLLKEERERKKLQKDLPALENQIFSDIEMYEEKCGKPFLYLGMDFRNFVTKQWDDRLAQKENEKLMRQKLRTKQMADEMTLGTTRNKRQLCATPKSAPSKLFKSTVGVPLYRTPNGLPSRPVPCTIAKMKSNNRPTLKSNLSKNIKNILKENNTKNNPSGSGLLNDTSYTDFAAKLDRSSRNIHRSSVLSSRKVVGTRISTSFKKNSKNKSTRKSIKKKTNTSRITPARGKLGLPFII